MLGQEIIRHLLGRGARVTVLVRSEKLKEQLDKWPPHSLSTVSGNVQDFACLKQALSAESCDTILHLAGHALVNVAKLDPRSALETNLAGTWNVLEAARLAKTRQVVVASSTCVYGSPEFLPYTELHPLRSLEPYAISKSCADLVCQMYASTYGVPICVIRCANLFGGGDLNFSRLVPGVIEATWKRRAFVFRSDGRSVRDYLYLKDAARGFLMAAEALTNDKSLAGEVFNLGLGCRLSARELVQTILNIMGAPELTPVVLGELSSSDYDQVVSSEKARALLGWTPRYGLEDGLRETVAWYERYFTAADTQVSFAAAGS